MKPAADDDKSAVSANERRPLDIGAPVRETAPAQPAPRPGPPPRPPWWRRTLGSVVISLVVTFGVTGLLLSFVAKPYIVPSGSMADTLQPGDRVLVNRLAYTFADPGTGDILVFDADETWGAAARDETDLIGGALRWLGETTGFGPSGPHTLLKRVIGTPGQTVECCSDTGAVIVDGEPLEENYITHDIPFVPDELDCTTEERSLRCFAEVQVPEASYLVLGDSRAASNDSAAECRTGDPPDDPSDDCWRWATRDGVVGTTALVLWPLSRFGFP